MKPITKGGQILSNRRKGALTRLEAQLLTGEKSMWSPHTNSNHRGSIHPLTKDDVSRINKEISILKSRI